MSRLRDCFGYIKLQSGSFSYHWPKNIIKSVELAFKFWKCIKKHGLCLDFGFQKVLIGNRLSKKFGDIGPCLTQIHCGVPAVFGAILTVVQQAKVFLQSST